MGGVKQKEEINLTTLSAFKMMFFGFLQSKGSFLDFFGFFKIRKLFWNQNRHIWGVKEKEKNQLGHSFFLFLVSEDPFQMLKNRQKSPKIAFFGLLPKVKNQLKEYILNIHGLSFLTMVLNVTVAVEMMEKLGV